MHVTRNVWDAQKNIPIPAKTSISQTAEIHAEKNKI